jgi:hypothetical protein
MVRDNAIMAGITTEAQFFFIPKQGADDEMEDRFLEGLIKGAQKTVAYCVANHPYTDRTGTNTKSFGWAAIKDGQVIGGTLPDSETGDIAVPVSGGVGVSRGAGGQFVSAGGKRPQVVVGGSSGYSGYLELGTSRMQPFPTIRPALNATKPDYAKSLTGIL